MRTLLCSPVNLFCTLAELRTWGDLDMIDNLKSIVSDLLFLKFHVTLNLKDAVFLKNDFFSAFLAFCKEKEKLRENMQTINCAIRKTELL